MLSLSDELSLKAKLSSFRPFILQHTVILLLLAGSGQTHGAQPPQRIMTLVGEDVVLPCRLEPPLDAVSKSVEWGRPDLEPRFVHVWHEGQDHLVNQNPSYKGRTSVSVDKLRQGDLSLLLSAVKLSDHGLYRCYFPSQDKTFYVELVVGSSRPLKSSDNAEEQGPAHGAQPSLRNETSGGKDKGSSRPLKSSENAEEQGQTQGAQPPLRMVTLVGEDVVLPCRLEPPLDAVSKSVEWARPDLEPRFVHVWHDGQDHLPNQNPSYRGRTSVSIDKLRQGDLSLLLSAVKLSDYGLYRCYFPSQNKTFSVELIVAGIFSITPPSSHSVIVAIVSGIAAGLAIAVVFVWKWKKTQTTKRKDSSDKKDQLRKQSMKTQEELSAWGEVFSPLMELKTGVVNQRETLRLQLEEIENEREENKEKIQSVEKKIAESEQEKATDRTEGYLREKKALLNAQWKLEKRKEEVEKQQLNMEKLLQKTEGMNVTVTERKRKVENQMEVIKSHLGEGDSNEEKARLH